MAFKRYDGFTGSIPQSFIDKNLKRCPMCGSSEPDWHLDSKLGWTANLQLFQCQSCKAVLSSPVADIAGFSKSIITTPGLMKKLSGKKLDQAYLKVEDVGAMQSTSTYKQQEFTLDELIEMSNQYGD